MLRVETDPPGENRLITLWKLPDLLTCRRYFEILLGDRLSWTDVEVVQVGNVNRLTDEDKTLI